MWLLSEDICWKKANEVRRVFVLPANLILYVGASLKLGYLQNLNIA
jgi:hypothetical protein